MYENMMGKRKNNLYTFIFIGIFISLLAVLLSLYIRQFNLNISSREIYNHNISFNEFDRNLKGNEIMSLINFTLDYNNKDANIDSNVSIEIMITDEKTISMDAVIRSGIDNFITYLGDQNFKIIDKEYYENGKISLMRYKLLDINSLNNIDGNLGI